MNRKCITLTLNGFSENVIAWKRLKNQMKVFNKSFEFPFKLRSMWAMISRVKHDTNVIRLTDDGRSHETILSFNCLKNKKKFELFSYSMEKLDGKKEFNYRIHWQFSSWTKPCCVDDFDFFQKYLNKTKN